MGPCLLHCELTNVFARLVKHKALTFEAALAGLESASRLVRLLASEPAPARGLEIASKLGLSAHDACYLAAAELMGAPLVTEDARLLGAAPEIARPLAGC